MQASRERVETARTDHRHAEQQSAAPPSLADVRTEELLRRVPRFEEVSYDVARGAHKQVIKSKALRKVADFFHGTWLGHPLHSALTDFVVGAWALGSTFDFINAATRSRTAAKAADQLIMMGSVAALPTAVAGFTDYTTIPKRATATGSTHGLLNAVALVLYTISLINRRRGDRGRGLLFSGLGAGLILITSWLGGELTYKYRVGVDKSPRPSKPKDWQAVMGEGELPEGEGRRVDVEGAPVLLFKRQGQLYAIGAVCAHEGGPLDKGKFHGTHVHCPWHQSVYDMRTGRVVHGPSTYAVPCYETRVRDGRIEVRLAER